ncbi:C2 family cysteine protease [Gordonia effusa]|uniref:C2 family cysteine protease n=1 Tax=Gordonia effusa TaxID=263908 RepID=UPI001478DCFF|nr:C2 family cysteine protease [Gordonia effusa]
MPPASSSAALTHPTSKNGRAAMRPDGAALIRDKQSTRGNTLSPNGGDCQIPNGRMTPVSPGITNRALTNAYDIKQGQVGDCWLVSAIKGFELSPAGRAGLKKMVTPSGNGYDVRLSVNGECRKIHVDKVISEGVRSNNGDQNIASVIEAAMLQYKGERISCGDFAFNSQYDITNHKSKTVKGWEMMNELTSDPNRTNASIANGTSIVIETTDKKDYNPITTAISTPSGISRGLDFQIVPHHAYTVTNVQADGIWVANPWGNGSYTHNGSIVDTGDQFWIPKDKIPLYFNDAAISAPIGEMTCVK